MHAWRSASQALGLVLLVAARCGGDGSQDVPAPRFVPPVKVAELEGEVVEARYRNRKSAKKATRSGSRVGPTVVWVVMSGVRVDATGLCVRDHPGTPFLSRLRKRAVSTVTCGGVAAATTPRPALASMLTGASVAQHGMFGPDDPLPDKLKTAAVLRRADGFRTVLVSADAGVGALDAGFETVRAPMSGVWTGAQVVEAVQTQVASMPRGKPLLVVVTLADARQALGEAQGDDAVRREAYARGVTAVDDAVRGVFEALQAAGRAESLELFVTSDHGLALGEHGAWGTEGPPHEGLARVPLLWMDTTDTEGLHDLPDAVSVRELVTRIGVGSRPPEVVDLTVVATGEGGRGAVAGYDGSHKRIVTGDGAQVFDLAADPLERSPQEADRGPELKALRREVDAVRRAWKRRVVGEPAPWPWAEERVRGWRPRGFAGCALGDRHHTDGHGLHVAVVGVAVGLVAPKGHHVARTHIEAFARHPQHHVTALHVQVLPRAGAMGNAGEAATGAQHLTLELQARDGVGQEGVDRDPRPLVLHGERACGVLGAQAMGGRQELLERDAQRTRQTRDDLERGVARARLQVGQGGPWHLGQRPETRLGEPASLAQVAQVGGEVLGELVGVGVVVHVPTIAACWYVDQIDASSSPGP